LGSLFESLDISIFCQFWCEEVWFGSCQVYHFYSHFLGEIGFVISNYPFLNLVLHMSLIDISFNIMSLSNEHKHDNLTNMLCMLIGTFLGDCFKLMVKWSNVYFWTLKFMKYNVKASDNWYLLMLHVLEVFDCGMWWWYGKLFYMGTIDITFLANLVKLCHVKCHFLSEFVPINKNTYRKVHWMILFIQWDLVIKILNVTNISIDNY
jgi:hypothetical protein